MTELLNGRHVPWDLVSGKDEPAVVRLPPPAHRDPAPALTVTVSVDEVKLRQRTQLYARAGLTASQIGEAIRRNMQDLMVLRSRR